MKRTTKTPVHWTERIRVILFLVVYVIWVESTFPTPFIQSRFGQLVYFIILLFVFKELWRYRQERSARFYKQTQRWYDKVQNRRLKLSNYTRWRIQRIIRFIFIAYSLGWLIDGSSDACSGALACTMSIPSLLGANYAELISFALRLAMSFMGIFGMMWLMARMDLHKTLLPDSIETRFSDVYGQDGPVERIKEVQAILDHPEEIEGQGGYMPGGVLLWGPPGTGKTLIAEAFAGETGKPFVSVGPESFTNMFVGVPVLKVKMLFRHLRKLSVKHGGVVCFFDEIDALGSRGGAVTEQINRFLAKMFLNSTEEMVITGGGAAGSGALQMLLTEMSGLAKPKGIYNKIRVMLGFKPVPPPKYRILWIGATNLMSALDPAMLRPGRFDRKIKIGYPDIPGRKETFIGYVNRVQNNLTDTQLEALARENPQATGASIKDAVNEGLLRTVREGREIVTVDDIRKSILEKTMGLEEGHMDLEVDRWQTAIHEAAHAVASHHFRPDEPIQYASVIKRERTGGFVRAVPEVETYTRKRKIIADIKVSLASVWAEKYFFGDENLSVGPGNDLEKATNAAKLMVARHAMGSTIMVWKDMEDLPEHMVREAQDTLHDIYEEMHDFMVAHRDQVEATAQLLQQYDTIDGQEIHDLLERMS